MSSLFQVGPGFYERWFQWQSMTPEQNVKAATRVELEKLLAADKDHKAQLSFEELTTVCISKTLKLFNTDE